MATAKTTVENVSKNWDEIDGHDLFYPPNVLDAPKAIHLLGAFQEIVGDDQSISMKDAEPLADWFLSNVSKTGKEKAAREKFAGMSGGVRLLELMAAYAGEAGE